MADIRNALQAWSNTAAENISAPVDGIAWLLRKAGIPVPKLRLMAARQRWPVGIFGMRLKAFSVN
jgi:hypothetical protein